MTPPHTHTLSHHHANLANTWIYLKQKIQSCSTVVLLGPRGKTARAKVSVFLTAARFFPYFQDRLENERENCLMAMGTTVFHILLYRGTLASVTQMACAPACLA